MTNIESWVCPFHFSLRKEGTGAQPRHRGSGWTGMWTLAAQHSSLFTLYRQLFPVDSFSPVESRSLEASYRHRHRQQDPSVCHDRAAAPYFVAFSIYWTVNRWGIRNSSRSVNFQCRLCKSSHSIFDKPACKLVWGGLAVCRPAWAKKVCKIRNWGVMWPVAGNSTQQQELDLVWWSEER